jgi:biotin synthase
MKTSDNQINYPLNLRDIEERCLSGGSIGRGEALAASELSGEELHGLFGAARRVTRALHGTRVDLCSIMNARSGHCSEDCVFCAQAGRYRTSAAVYPLLSKEEILERALKMEAAGARRFSLVTSGRGTGSNDLQPILAIYRLLREKTGLFLCASLGIVGPDEAAQLKEAGVGMYHHNIESARSHFSNICTTHTFEERVETVRAVRTEGLAACCGGILGLGESWPQRVEMAFHLKEMDVQSVPLNIITPVEGTPLAGAPVPAPLEILRAVAVFRLVLPGAVIRLAGGREAALRDMQAQALLSGANGLMVGNYLTTGGRGVEDDLRMIADLGLVTHQG